MMVFLKTGAILAALAGLMPLPAFAATCSADCADLGYTITDSSKCVSPVVKCPFDQSKVYCITTCAVGDIYYADNSCSTNYDSTKVPVGIVIIVDANKISGAIAALTDESKYWMKNSSGSYYYDFTCIPNVTGTSDVIAQNDAAGRANTNCMLTEGTTKGVDAQAAKYCNTYRSAGTGAGSWYFPAFGEIYDALGLKRNLINTQLAKIPSATKVIDSHIWTSSEYSDGYSHAMITGGSYAQPPKDATLPTRCITKFPLSQNSGDEEVTKVCADYNESDNVFAEDCTPGSYEVCIPTSLTGAGGQVCKFNSGCTDDATCAKYTITNMISNPSLSKIREYGQQYCTNKDGFDSLLWINPQCSNVNKLCLRCDSPSCTGQEDCPANSTCSSCNSGAGTRYTVTGCSAYPYIIGTRYISNMANFTPSAGSACGNSRCALGAEPDPQHVAEYVKIVDGYVIDKCVDYYNPVMEGGCIVDCSLY